MYKGSSRVEGDVCGSFQDNDSDYLTPRSTFTSLPDVLEQSAALALSPSIMRDLSIPEELESSSSMSSKKRVFIPELPVTPFGEPRYK